MNATLNVTFNKQLYHVVLKDVKRNTVSYVSVHAMDKKQARRKVHAIYAAQEFLRVGKVLVA